MASWQTEVTQSTYDANSVVSNMEVNRARDTYAEPSFLDRLTGKADPNGNVFGTVGGETKSGFFGEGRIAGYNIVGINGNQVGTMCSAIEEYVAGVQSVLKTAIDTAQADLTTGFKGSDAETEVKAYLEKTREYVKNLVSSLNSFQSKLNDIGNAWVKAQSAIGTTVNTSAGAFSAGEEYVQQVQYNGPSGS